MIAMYSSGGDDILEAVLYTLPLYEMSRMRAANSLRQLPTYGYAGESPASTTRWLNGFTHTRRLLGADDNEVVSPNNDTLYTNAWLDLSRGPLYLSVPDMGERYYVLGLLDFYTNPFKHLGTYTRGNSRRRYLLHGPRHAPPVDTAGVETVLCPTDAVWLIGRIAAVGSADVEMAAHSQDGFVLTRPDGTSAWSHFDTGIQPDERVGDPLRFAQVVNESLRTNPPPGSESDRVASFARFGLGAGLEAGESARHLRTLGKAIKAALQYLSAPSQAAVYSGWRRVADVDTSFGEQYHERARVALQCIGTLGRQEALYLVAELDARGQVLSGREARSLTFAPDNWPKCDAFWSLSLYDARTRLFHPNSIDRWSIGDRTAPLHVQPDGSLHVHISNTRPEGEVNWLPAPDGPYYLMLRLYCPHFLHLSDRFAYPAIEPLGDSGRSA